MATASTIQFPASTPTNPSALSDEIRYRALARLYERRDAVDELIGSLERYQERQQERQQEGQREGQPLVRAECVAINVVAK